jgi:hypothetical protein
MMTRTRRRSLLALALTGAALVVGASGCDHHAHGDRQAEVRQRGQHVMPFDLRKTTHVFEKTGTGGVESVVVKSQVDRDQLPLIRAHLRKEQQLFTKGDFSDPMAIHGMKMPGIDTLRRNAEQLRISYRDLPRGAQLRYATNDAEVLNALHTWFDAQVMDHGADAQP